MLRSYPHLRNVMIVMYTTPNFHADKDFAKGLNARFVTKPVERQELNTVTNELLAKCGLLSTNNERARKTIIRIARGEWIFAVSKHIKHGAVS
jgi:two-component SAPR family response regulator